MSSQDDRHQPNPRQADPPPMGELLTLLRSNGFFVTTDDYVSLLKIVEYFGDEGLDSLGQRICPIIATTPEEQERFRQVFETYKRSQAAEAPQPEVRIAWAKWIIGIVVLVLVTLAIMVEEGRDRLPASIGLPQSDRDTVKIAAGQAFVADVLHTGIFYGREGDTEAVRVRWEDAGRGEIGRGLRISQVLAAPGLHIIRRSISSSTLPVGKSADTMWVFVCPVLPRLRIYPAVKPIMAGQAVTLTASVESGEGLIRAYSWSVDAAAGGQISRRTDTPGLTHTFDTAGIYNITCTPLLSAAIAGCLQSAQLTVQVIDTAKQYALTYAGGPGQTPAPSRLKGWPGLLFLLVGSGVCIWAFRREKREKKQEAQNDKRTVVTGKGPPYEVPFEPVRPGEVVIDKSLRRFLQLLRQGAEEEVSALHIHKTIGATIRAGGLTNLVFAPRKSAQEYIVFTDHSAPQGMLSCLYRFVVELMEEEGVPLTHFYYDEDFNCFNAQFPAGTTLRHIADNHGSSIPIIFGDGAALLQALAPALRPSLQQELLRWELRLLITPRPVKDWGIRENTLSKHMMLSAADSDSLLRLGQSMRSSAKARKVEIRAGGSATTTPDELAGVEGLRRYLGADEALFQWLCGLCVYPKPRWELIIRIGRAILAQYPDRLSDLRYDQLLRLCRIPWLAEGSFPQRLRMELLKSLTVQNEIAARAALLELFDQVDKQYPGAYVFSREKGLQETVSRFVIYANDPTARSGYADAAEEFYRLFKDGRITDVPLRKYLDKADDQSWATPLDQQNEAVGLARYFDVRESARNRAEQEADAGYKRKKRRKQAVAAVALIVLGGMWSALFFSSSLRSSPRLAALYAKDLADNVALTFRVQKDFTRCGDSSSDFSLLPGTLSVNDQPYPLTFDEGSQTLSASVPYSAIQQAGGSATVMLGTGGRAGSVVAIPQLGAAGILTATCAKYEPTFAPGALPQTLNELWAGRESGRLMNVVLDRRQIYEAGAPQDGFTRYRIDTVVHAAGIYKIVATAIAEEYNLLIISNVQPGSFGLIICDRSYPTIEEALKASELCGKYEPMQLYYDHKDTGKIYLPVAGSDLGFSPLVEEERSKVLSKLLAHSSESLYFEQFNNSFYIRTQQPYDLSKEISAYDASAAARVYRKSMTELGQNPFQRPYLTLSFSRKAGSKNDLQKNTARSSADDELRARVERQRAAAAAERRRQARQPVQLQDYDSMMKNNFTPQRAK